MNRKTGYALAAACALTLAATSGVLRAATIAIPNYSFESPTQDISIFIDYWQQAPDPTNTLTGLFSNVPPPIDNCDGGQAAFLFANPGVALFQDYNSTDYAHPSPLHAFNAIFEPGKSYTLTVGVIGGGGGMTEATLDLSLYYRNAQSNMVNVGVTRITNTPALFPSHYHFVDRQVLVPTVQAGDPWAGQHIGIQILSSVSSSYTNGGYWDLDNARLSSAVTPALVAPGRKNGQFSFTLQSDPGLVFEILASTNLTLPLSNWTSLGTLTNVTGATPFSDPTTGLNRRFYRARQVF